MKPRTGLLAPFLGLLLATVSRGADAVRTAGSVAAATAKDQRHARESDAFFAGPIQRFEVRCPKESLESLRQDPRKPVPATVTVGTNVFGSVMIHVKGAAGSTRSVDDNPALTLNFDKQAAGQRLQGLDKIHLNNSVQDPSRLSEIVCSDLYLAAGVPTPRATQALVRFNGRDLGLYVVKEGFNRTFLARHFAQRTGNLYDGGFLRDVDQDLVREAGDGPDTHADLKRLVAGATIADPTRRWEALSALVDVDRFATYTALQVLTEDWDGYPCKRNNYRVYHDPGTDKFVFFPHGMDQMFGRGGMPLEPGFEGLVADRLFQTGEFRELYWRKIASLLETTFTTNRMFAAIDAATARRQANPLARGRADLGEIDGAANDLRQRIAHRVRDAREQFSRRPRPIAFDDRGEWHPVDWENRTDDGNVKATRRADRKGHPVLQLEAHSAGAGSWRTRARLPAGRYRFEASASTRNVVALRDQRGRGLGLRVGGAPRQNELVGTAAWKTLAFDFSLEREDDVDFVAELRARSGTGWFDPASMVVRRMP